MIKNLKNNKFYNTKKFYSYLKSYVESLYTTIENYDSQSQEFGEMLKINDFFINNVKTQKVLYGGNPIKKLEEMKESITKLLENMRMKNDDKDNGDNAEEIEKISKRITQISLIFSALISYIEQIHALIPKNSNFDILNQQLHEINQILDKHIGTTINPLPNSTTNPIINPITNPLII